MRLIQTPTDAYCARGSKNVNTFLRFLFFSAAAANSRVGQSDAALLR